MKTYAAYYVNDVRKKSSSGAIFSIIAKEFDVIYGVAMDDDNRSAIFIRTDMDITRLRGSKYLQANVGNTYINVKEDLENCKKVLFTGTACQVNGLKLYLKKEYPNLFLMDIVCHGVPTVRLWEKYIEGRIVSSISFRAKDDGWNDYGMKINETFIPKHKNKYMQLYLTNNALRPSCYHCICKQNKQSDITVGDFWGIHHFAPEMDDNMGTSLIIIRTSKGLCLFDKISSDINYKEINYSDGVKYNNSEYKSVTQPFTRDIFFEDLDKLSFDELHKKYVRHNCFESIKVNIKYYIKKLLFAVKDR